MWSADLSGTRCADRHGSLRCLVSQYSFFCPLLFISIHVSRWKFFFPKVVRSATGGQEKDLCSLEQYIEVVPIMEAGDSQVQGMWVAYAMEP